MNDISSPLPPGEVSAKRWVRETLTQTTASDTHSALPSPALTRDLSQRERRIAVIGAGWAGCAAALTLSRAGNHVTVFEAAKIAGGRARRVEKDERSFDNGQHLLLGAYTRSLEMIHSLHGARINEVIDQRPLALIAASGNEAQVAVRAGNLPAPLHLLVAMLTANGLSFAEKMRVCAWCAKTLFGAFDESQSATMCVAELIGDQPLAAKLWLWEPLCVAALNTPAERASARVFVEVLRRAFLGSKQASDMVIPRVDLSKLLPEPALDEISQRGGDVYLGKVVLNVAERDGKCLVITRESDGEIAHEFDRVIIATGPQHINRLLSVSPNSMGQMSDLFNISYEPISTLHYEFSAGVDPESSPMLMLDGEPGQWLFTHRLKNGRVRASVVISAHHREESAEDLLRNGLAQLRKSFALPNPIWQQLVTEKRATYSCTPKQSAMLQTLPKSIGRIHFAGDWCVPELPATLESAVIAGENAARAVLASE
jgi:hydroxysqualene dehydroxylase